MMTDSTTGKELGVGEVWSGSLSIIRHKPVVLLPIFIVLAFELLLGILTRFFIVFPERITSIKDSMLLLPSLLPAMFISFVLIYVIAYPVFGGMYPLLVKDIVEKKKIDLKTAFKSAVKKAPTFIAADIILILLILAGLLFFIIPSIIFSIWYFYITPLIMLENKGVFDAMKASKKFAGDKKFKTFLYFLLPFSILIFFDISVRLITAIIMVSLISVYAMNDIVPLIVTSRAVLDFVLSLFFYSWLSVIPAYVYIKNRKDGSIEGGIKN